MSDKRRIGALVIGQSPRPDLVALFGSLAPDVEVVEAGALDEADTDRLPPTSAGDYPLTTSLRDGRAVTVAESVLTGLLQTALDRLESELAVEATVLLCAGPFESLAGARPVVKPFSVTVASLAALGIERIGVVCPYSDQLSSAATRWRRDRLQPTVWVKPPDEALEEWLPKQAGSSPDLEAVVLDFVGYPEEAVMASKERLGVPLLDPGRLATAVAASIVGGTNIDAARPRSGAEKVVTDAHAR